MILLVLLVVLLCVVLWFGPLLVADQGYLMLVLGSWTVEITLFGLALIALLSVCALWILGCLIRSILKIRHWNWHPFRERKQKKAQEAFERAGLALASGRYHQAEQAFEEAGALTDYRRLRLQMACYAAFEAGHQEKAFELADALEESALTTRYVKADLLLRQKKAHEALAVLAPSMKNDAPSLLVPLYFEALLQAGQAEQVLELIPKAIEQRWLSKEEWAALRYTIYPKAIHLLAEGEGFSTEASYWKGLPAKERNSTAAQLAQARLLATQGNLEEAERMVVDHLSYKDLALCWPLLQTIPLKRHVNALRKQLQHWLRDHPEDSLLYSVLAYCAEQEGERAQAQLAHQKASELRHYKGL